MKRSYYAIKLTANWCIASSARLPVPSTITHSDSVLSGFRGKLLYNVKPSSPNGQAIMTDVTTLDNYNNDLLTSGCGG